MKARSAFLFGLSGSLGDMTARKAKDGSTILSQKIVDPTYSRTPAQDAQRLLFGKIQAIGSAILAVLAISFKILKPTHSNYNSFISVNAKNMAGVDVTNEQEVGAALQVSRGTTPINFQIPINEGAGVFSIGWVDDSDAGLGSATDVLDLLHLNTSNGAHVLDPAVKQRSQIFHEQTVKTQVGYPQSVYGWMRNTTTNECSNSKYMGTYTSATVFVPATV